MATFIDRLHCFTRSRHAIRSNEDVTEVREGDEGKGVRRDVDTLSTIVPPGRRSMIIATWGLLDVNAFEDVIIRIMHILASTNLEPVEAITACGFVGKFHGLDEQGKAMILRFPEELLKVCNAGKALVTGGT